MTLYCFGDSYTEGYKNDMNFHPYAGYRKSLGVEDPQDMPPVWPEILGKKLGIESYNHGRGGGSNHETMLKVCEQSHKFQKGDIVIINWTYVQRCLWDLTPVPYNDTSYKLTSISPYQGEHYDPEGIYMKAYEIIAVNRLTFTWTYEVLRYQQIIDSLAKSVGFDVYYWYTDDVLFFNMKQIENMNQRKYIIHDLIDTYDESVLIGERKLACIPFNILKQYGAKTISEDSNGMGMDEMHLGGTGHRVQAEIFYSYLAKTPYPKKLQKYL